MSDLKKVNGNYISWGSAELKIDNQRYFGFTEVSFGHSRERVKGYGMGADHAPRGRSAGKYATDAAKLKGPKDTLEAVREHLASLSADGLSYGDVTFEVVLSYIETGHTPQNVEIQECVIVKESETNTESADPLSEEIELDCMRIIKNGRTLYNQSV